MQKGKEREREKRYVRREMRVGRPTLKKHCKGRVRKKFKSKGGGRQVRLRGHRGNAMVEEGMQNGGSKNEKS